jgi:hypothetical protein
VGLVVERRLARPGGLAVKVTGVVRTRRYLVVVPFATMAFAAGCGGSASVTVPGSTEVTTVPQATSGSHSLANVKAALNAAGMKNFKTISRATIMGGKQEPGVDPSKILGGFVYSKQRGSSVVAITIAVASDPSVLDAMQRAIVSEGKGLPGAPVRFVRSGNVLISSIVAPARARFPILAKIPDLAAYLNGGGATSSAFTVIQSNTIHVRQKVVTLQVQAP